jgi:hypothetical protein
MFVPHAQHYLTRLSKYLHSSQGLLHVKKENFTDLFRPANKASFMRWNVLKAFEATRISLDNSEVILKRFKATTSAQQEALQMRQSGDGDSHNNLQKLFNTAVLDKLKVEAKQLSTLLHSLQVNNKLVHHKNQKLKNTVRCQAKDS